MKTSAIVLPEGHALRVALADKDAAAVAEAAKVTVDAVKRAAAGGRIRPYAFYALERWRVSVGG